MARPLDPKDPQQEATVIVIPTRDHAETKCIDLIKSLGNTYDAAIILDNNPKPALGPNKLIGHIRIFHTPNMNIYEMWQHGWDAALALYPDCNINLAFLNDDIQVPSVFLTALGRALRNSDFWITYPDVNAPSSSGFELEGLILDETFGSYRHGGMTGWAFMLRGELLREGKLPRLDTQYEWWYGDDDLAFTVDRWGGKQARVRGLLCEHESEATASLHPWTHEARERDEKRFNLKWYPA